MCSNVSLLKKKLMKMSSFYTLFFIVICTMETKVDNSLNALTEGMVRLFTIRNLVKVFFILLNILLCKF